MARGAVDTGAIVHSYQRDGFCGPLDVLNEEQALSCRAELERLEGRIGEEKLGKEGRLNDGDIVLRFADELVRHRHILVAQSQALYQESDAA